MYSRCNSKYLMYPTMSTHLHLITTVITYGHSSEKGALHYDDVDDAPIGVCTALQLSKFTVVLKFHGFH